MKTALLILTILTILVVYIFAIITILKAPSEKDRRIAWLLIGLGIGIFFTYCHNYSYVKDTYQEGVVAGYEEGYEDGYNDSPYKYLEE